MTAKPLAPLALVAAAALAACGSSGSASSTHSAAPRGTTAVPPPATPAQSAPSEATSAATGDIPDNQVFLTFRDPRLGVSLRYPEGWTERRGPNQVSFTQNANQITVTVSHGAAPGPAQVRAQLAAERGRLPQLSVGSVTRVALPAGPAVKATYSVRSRPDPVTGKRLALVIDRYVFARGGRVAVLDLGTAKGVDNVDAYRMISRSFRWL